jgi:hypothetical protein
MFAAVNFNDDFRIKTREIQDLVLKGDLPTKIEAYEPAIAQ